MKKYVFDPFYAASQGYSAEHILHIPVLPNGSTPDGIEPSDDPIINHERWAGIYKHHPIQLPTGTVSGVVALRINKPNHLNSSDGSKRFQPLLQHYGWYLNTASFEDSRQRMYLYRCHDEVIIAGVAEIAPGVTLHGNGAYVTLPPYPCYETNKLIGWDGGLRLTQENLSPVPPSLMDCAVHILSVTESYDYYIRDAA